jgi:putative ABC transport system permease protein
VVIMLEHAKATIRHRKGPFVGMFVAVLCAAALVTALGVLFESGLRCPVSSDVSRLCLV